jgi:hypothetical protein
MRVIIPLIDRWRDKIGIFTVGGDSKKPNLEQHTTFETTAGFEGRWTR